MKILESHDLKDIEFAFWDNDALKMAYSEESIIKKLSDSMPNASLILPIPVCIEFFAGANSVYEVHKKRLFLQRYQKDFIKYTFKRPVAKIIEATVLELRRLYSGLKLPGNPSYIDLLLQAYTVALGQECVVITKSVSDFNSRIMEPIGLLDIDLLDSESNRQQVFVLRVNKKNLIEEKMKYTLSQKKADGLLTKES